MGDPSHISGLSILVQAFSYSTRYVLRCDSVKGASYGYYCHFHSVSAY